LFFTLWADYVGPKWLAKIDDKGVGKLFSLCESGAISEPDNLKKYFFEMASDGIDAPVFPDKPRQLPKGWL